MLFVTFAIIHYSRLQWPSRTGNEEVVHLAGTENDGINGNFNSGHVFTICGKSFNKAQVKKEDIWNVICGSKIKINNDKDKKCEWVQISYVEYI